MHWINALRARDFQALNRYTSFPFQLRDTGEEGNCESHLVERSEALESGAKCLMSDDLLHEDLVSNPELLIKPLSKDILPDWALQWRSTIDSGLSAVAAEVPGNGATFQFILLVQADGVRGFWKHASFESN
jgi:hypothetical protein